MKLTGGVYLVTGGSSGLGAATARRFYAAGARVLICSRDLAKGEQFAKELGPRALFVRADVSSETDAASAVDMAMSEFGSLQGIINCAGIGLAACVMDENGRDVLESLLRCLQVNLVGTFNMIRFAALAMAENVPNAGGERGVIVNTASIVGYEGQIGAAGYAASNAGIIGLTLPIARELAQHGIRVMTIAPGPFLTPRLESLPCDVLAQIDKITQFPRRLGRADEYAALAEHIVENEMLNGETIRLDGAVRLPPKFG